MPPASSAHGCPRDFVSVLPLAVAFTSCVQTTSSGASWLPP
jgi:hypothetical protein